MQRNKCLQDKPLNNTKEAGKEKLYILLAKYCAQKNYHNLFGNLP